VGKGRILFEAWGTAVSRMLIHTKQIPDLTNMYRAVFMDWLFKGRNALLLQLRVLVLGCVLSLNYVD